MTHARHGAQTVRMTQDTASGNVPSLTLGWRLRMSLDYARISVQEMADQLGVSRATLSRWMGDKGERPKRAYVSQWALRTGVPFEWLDKGIAPPDPGPDDSGSRTTIHYPRQPGAQVVRLHQTDKPPAPNVLRTAA